MTAWVHKECDTIVENALDKLQAAWDSSEQEDECIVCLNDLERAYWMGTEIGQLGGHPLPLCLFPLSFKVLSPTSRK